MWKNPDKLVSIHLVNLLVLILALIILLYGCVKHQYVPQPVDTEDLVRQMNSWSVNNPELNRFLVTNGIASETLSTHEFTFGRFYLTGLFYHPGMQTAYKKWQKASLVASHANTRLNPEISIPLEYHSDTSDGQSPWTIGAVLSFIYERKGKREARHAEAMVNLLNARLEMEKLAFENYGKFQNQYLDYVMTHAKINEFRNEIKVLEELSSQLIKKFELGGSSQFEISTVDLELQQRRFQLGLYENRLQASRDRLLAMTFLAHHELEAIEIRAELPLISTREVFGNTDLLNQDLSTLQYELLNGHIDMALQLNEYARAEARLRLEIEKQYPDIVLSPGFIFDQSDNIWALGASWVLPLFMNNRQNLEILKALEDRKIRQQEIITLQKNLLNSLYQIHRSLQRHHQTISASDEIIAVIEQRAVQIQEQIDLGGIDGTTLLRNRMEYYRAKQTQAELLHAAASEMVEFEQLMQRTHAVPDIREIVEAWLAIHEEKNNVESDR